MAEQLLVQIINSEMGIELPLHISFEAMRLQLQALVNDMIKTDFQKLVNVLYRVDVNERKLKYLLQENVGEDAAVIIADLIIERQMEKIKVRREFTGPEQDISDDEKW